MRAERTANIVSLCTGLLSKTGLGSTQALQQPVLLTVPPVWGHGTTFKNDTVYHNYIAEHFFHALLEARSTVRRTSLSWTHKVSPGEHGCCHSMFSVSTLLAHIFCVTLSYSLSTMAGYPRCWSVSARRNGPSSGCGWRRNCSRQTAKCESWSLYEVNHWMFWNVFFFRKVIMAANGVDELFIFQSLNVFLACFFHP